MTDLSIVIPAYNEAESVKNTVHKLLPVLADLKKTYNTEVIFVDDGSRDNTVDQLRAAFADEAAVQIVEHRENRGLGAAIRTGFEYTSGEIVVTTDFDGTYAFDTIPTLVTQLLAQQADIVTASPYHPNGAVAGVPRYRLLFSFGASIFYRILVKWRIHTWTALYRAYRCSVIQTIPFESDGFLANTELLVNALRAGYTVDEFPTILRQREFGQSSIKIAQVTLLHLKYISALFRNGLPFIGPASIKVYQEQG